MDKPQYVVDKWTFATEGRFAEVEEVEDIEVLRPDGDVAVKVGILRPVGVE